jgi:CBS-domain-containing membrane protein
VDVETIYYTYILDNLKRLKGVVSLRDLLSAPDDAKISEIMEGEVISVKEDMDQEEVARILETYGFLAIPVTDSYNRLLGIITVETSWRSSGTNRRRMSIRWEPWREARNHIFRYPYSSWSAIGSHGSSSSFWSGRSPPMSSTITKA